MNKIEAIVTHPGGAHKDEFLACSVLLAEFGVSISRRDPTPEDLNNPSIAVVDIGHRHEPELSNFDHHQLPKDHVPTCSLSLILQALGLYEDGRQFCDWLETAEWFDCRGPISTAQWLGITQEVLNKLNSPIDITLLRRFALKKHLEPGDPLWEMMRMIGEDLLNYIRNLRTRLDFIGRHSQVWDLTLPDGPARVLFLPRLEPMPEEPSMGIETYIRARELSGIIGMIYPDRRGAGYGLSRYQDNPRLDFTRIDQAPDVHFAHARGFVAKTSATDLDRLRALLLQAANS